MASAAEGAGAASAAVMSRPSDKVKDIRELLPGTNMFFDDDETNVASVNDSIQNYNRDHSSDPPILLEAFYCPPDPDNLSLINSAGDRVPVKNVKSYITNKISGKKISGESVLSEPLRDLLYTAAVANPKPNPLSVGKGLTLEMIEKIIDFERSEKRGLSTYFFDFDRLLSLVQKFPFFDTVEQLQQR
jgi:hypothetical protein